MIRNLYETIIYVLLIIVFWFFVVSVYTQQQLIYQMFGYYSLRICVIHWSLWSSLISLALLFILLYRIVSIIDKQRQESKS